MSVGMIRCMKPLEFLGSSQKDLREMPAEVRHALGLELMTVQFGGEPGDFKSMPEVGAGAYEIRYRDTANGAFRVMYVAKFADAVYVLHAFQKKTQKTAKYDIALAAKRYKMIGA
jgi:phage-related protein